MSATERQTGLKSSRFSISRGLLTVGIAVVVLFVLSAILAPSSVSQGAVLGMLPFASILACVGLGQMLVVQQGGIDLSIPGAVSLAIVVVSKVPNGDNSVLLPAILLAVLLAVLAGVLNGILVGWLKLNAIIATLGTNALLFAVVIGISGGSPTTTTRLLQSIAGGLTFGIPNSVFFAVGAFLVLTLLLKKTVAGRRFEAIGANPVAARATGLRVRIHQSAAYVWAQLLYCLAGILLAGITAQPTAFQGNTYLIPGVAVVVLAGTSLLGGRGYPLATIVAALFLSQLDQFVLAVGVPYAVRSIVQAAALAVGVGMYTINWAALRARLFRPRVKATA
jgi:ribose transport system permease protein